MKLIFGHVICAPFLQIFLYVYIDTELFEKNFVYAVSVKRIGQICKFSFIFTFRDEFPMILVGNKSDLDHERTVSVFSIRY